jgi:putative DNA primase/helicase
MHQDINEAARGRWPDILACFAGLSDRQLTDEHQPCPLCGGTDRYRFDDKDGSGSWFCNQCGGKNQSGGAGSGMDLLMRRTGWEFKDAARRVEEHLGIARQTVQTVHRPVAGNLGHAQASEIRMVEPTSEPPTRGAEHVWRYSPTFLVCRFPGKVIRPLTWDGQRWTWKAPVGTSRPLLHEHRLAERPDAPVLVVEGEKTADAAVPLFPHAVVVTWSGGCKAISKTAWSALAGRKVVLWPDNDAPGDQAMDELGQRLLELPGTTVRIVANDPAWPEGWDLADAQWTPQEAAAWVKAHLADVAPRAVPAPLLAAPAAEAEPELPPPAASAYFQCLGFDGDTYYYQPASTGQVLRLSRSSHNSTNLVAIAPLPYWETMYPGTREGVKWVAAAASLFQQCAAVGVYSPERIRGRGAWYDAGRSVVHLGDRLVVDGETVPITAPFKSRYLYQRAQALDGPGSRPLTAQEAAMVADLACRFRWEVPASGLLLAGWATLAPICGALEWRPHAWLTGGAGTGKSAILDKFVSPLLADLGLNVAGNTSEAGLRQALRSDALPVVFDEAESNEKQDQARMQNVLALARVASSESHAKMLKGSPSGEVTRFHIRSMFFMSSISTALKQGADRTRFAQLTLRNGNDVPKAERQAHWESLERDLDETITPEFAVRLIARTVALIPIIRQSCKVFTRVAADAFDSQRLGDQYGTLLAGAWALMSDHVPTDAEARALIAANDWEPYSQTTEVPDEVQCIQRLLQHQIRIETDHGTFTRTMGEVVDLAQGTEQSMDITRSTAQGALGRHGLRVDDGHLLVSNTAQAIRHILQDTPWAHSWATVLARLPGAERAGVVHFKGAGAKSRALRLPLAQL